jgi:ABC-2 type transport system ATP-binding protein
VEGLRGTVEARLGVRGTILGRSLRFERPDAPAFLRSLLEAFPREIESFSVGRPSLEDVFIARTGHRFWSGTE